MKALGRFLLRTFFGCRHHELTWVFSDDEGLYRRCLDCGRRFTYTHIQFKRRTA